jgi:sterol 3beta-glucosyltransferase
LLAGDGEREETTMRIAILANGTRGDVQPKLALGEELQRRGHSVVITVNQNLAVWARRSTVEIVTLPLDSEALLKSDEGVALLAKGDTLRLNQQMSRAEFEANLPMLEAFREACRGADLILSCALTMFRGATMAEYFQVPHAVIATAPWLTTGEFPMFLAPVRTLGSQLLHRASYDLYWSLWWKGLLPAIVEMRQALGLPELKSRPRVEQLPTVGIYSEVLSPRPREWRADHEITGFIAPTRELRARLGEGGLPAGLEAWLNAGDAPVYFGFGSMPVQDPRAMLEMVAKVTRKKGLRALIGAGWSQFASERRADMEHVFIAPAFDHDRVLPACRAAVHHGGAGTTGAVLRAGLPALIATVFADQPFWAWRVANAGAGVAARFRDLSPRVLDHALERLLMPDMQHKARAMGAALRAESGAESAAEVIERWVGVRASRRPAA